jgi:PAS domain-containing protein
MRPQVLPTVSKFAVFDLLATQVAVVNVEGKVLFANSALEDLLGSSRRSLIAGRHFCRTTGAQKRFAGGAKQRFRSAALRSHFAKTFY